MQKDGDRTPLAGVRVLDFSIMVAGPYCARLLADVGGRGHQDRAAGRRRHAAADAAARRPQHLFRQLNAGKRSLALDLKNADAIKLVHRMVAEADILVENFRPGVMDRLGLGYDALREINPRLIYCSISGYGQTGPAA